MLSLWVATSSITLVKGNDNPPLLSEVAYSIAIDKKKGADNNNFGKCRLIVPINRRYSIDKKQLQAANTKAERVQNGFEPLGLLTSWALHLLPSKPSLKLYILEGNNSKAINKTLNQKSVSQKEILALYKEERDSSTLNNANSEDSKEHNDIYLPTYLIEIPSLEKSKSAIKIGGVGLLLVVLTTAIGSAIYIPKQMKKKKEATTTTKGENKANETSGASNNNLQ